MIIGGAGHNIANGNKQDDMVFGDNAFLLRRIFGETSPVQTDITSVQNITSGRFETLCGTLLYSRTDRLNACSFGNPVDVDNSGRLLVNGVWRNYRDPDSSGIAGSPQLDVAPWWAEYGVAFDYDFTDDDQFHTFAVDNGTKGAGSFGNDYLAGGEAHDMVVADDDHRLGQDLRHLHE